VPDLWTTPRLAQFSIRRGDSLASVTWAFRQQPGEMTMMLEPQSLIAWLVIGLIAGWLAGQIVKGYGFGLVGNLVVGVVGAFIGGWLLSFLNIHIGGGILAAIINATIGAVVLLVIVGLFKRA